MSTVKTALLARLIEAHEGIAATRQSALNVQSDVAVREYLGVCFDLALSDLADQIDWVRRAEIAEPVH